MPNVSQLQTELGPPAVARLVCVCFHWVVDPRPRGWARPGARCPPRAGATLCRAEALGAWGFTTDIRRDCETLGPMTPTAPQAPTGRPSPWALARWSAPSCLGLTFAILLTVLLAACGGDDDAATTTTTLPFETTTTFPVDDDDQAAADSGASRVFVLRHGRDR